MHPCAAPDTHKYVKRVEGQEARPAGSLPGLVQTDRVKRAKPVRYVAASRRVPGRARRIARTARLQTANGAKTPILLRTSAGSGHGGGHGNGTSLDDRVAENVDMFAFLMDRLGMKYRPPAPPKS